ncbi:MFS family permease [Anoxybacillus eryuanensis]
MKKWLLIIIAVSLMLIAPALSKRHEAEWNNRTYEMIMPYDEIEVWLQEENETDVWKQLKEAGLTTVSVEAETLDSLEKSGHVLLLKMDEFKHALVLLNETVDHIPSRGLVVYPLDDIPIVSSLQATFGDDVKAVQVNGKTYYIIEGNAKKIERVPLGYDEMKMARLIEQGLMVVLRIPDARDMNEASVRVLQQIETLKNEHTFKLLPTGEEVAGYPADVEKWGKRWKEVGYALLSTEFYEAKGLTTLAKAMNVNVVRLHSLNLEQRKQDEAVDVAIRAIKERNIRALFIRPYTSAETVQNIEKTVAVMKQIVQHMPSHYTLGKSEPFAPIERSSIATIGFIVGATAFIFLAIRSLVSPLLAFVAAGGAFVLGIAGTVLSIDLALKALALLVAIVTPIYAAKPSSVREGWRGTFMAYGRAIAISFVGISWIVAMLYGNEYIAYVGEGFRGVKLVYVVPLVAMVMLVLPSIIQESLLPFIKRLWKHPITIGHVVVSFFIFALLAYYVLRSGNTGTASALELAARQKLEEWLYVRPRTKEFLLGFPAYMLALFVINKQKKLGAVLLVVGTIGWLSIMNTFTHLHIPLFISFIRTMYSLGLGLLIGIVLIYVYEWVWKKVIR